MKLIIMTPYYHTNYNIVWLEINTPTGNYIIQQGHAPIILSLAPNSPITFRLKTGKQETFSVHNGIIKVNRESATITMTTLKE